MGYNSPIDFDTADPQSAEFMDYYANWANASGVAEQMGVRFETRYSNQTVDELIDKYKSKNASSDEIRKYISEELGLDTTKAYGNSSKEKADIANAVRRISENYNRGNQYQKAGKGHGSGLEKYSQYLQDFSGAYGESSKDLVPVETGEMNQLSVFRQLRKLGPNAAQMSDRNLQKAFGKDADLARIRELAGSEDYQTYNTYQDIAQNQLALQDQTLKNFMDAQKRINDPNFVKESTDAAFAPAETAYRQYYEPSGGAKVSEFGAQVGEAESAAGRIGDVRTRESAARQKGLAMERLQADKRAYAGNLQNMVNFGNPMDALRAGAAQGPQAAQYAQAPSNQQFSLVQQLFPYTSQMYNQSLTPFQYSQPIPKGPSGWDYTLGGIQAGADIVRGAAAWKGA